MKGGAGKIIKMQQRRSRTELVGDQRFLHTGKSNRFLTIHKKPLIPQIFVRMAPTEGADGRFFWLLLLAEDSFSGPIVIIILPFSHVVRAASVTPCQYIISNVLFQDLSQTCPGIGSEVPIVARTVYSYYQEASMFVDRSQLMWVQRPLQRIA